MIRMLLALADIIKGFRGVWGILKGDWISYVHDRSGCERWSGTKGNTIHCERRSLLHTWVCSVTFASGITINIKKLSINLFNLFHVDFNAEL